MSVPGLVSLPGLAPVLEFRKVVQTVFQLVSAQVPGLAPRSESAPALVFVLVLVPVLEFRKVVQTVFLLVSAPVLLLATGSRSLVLPA